MSALKEFLHKLIDRAGVSELHSEVDALPEDGSEVASDGSEAAVETPESGEEAAPNA